jgi:hypothetical protein
MLTAIEALLGRNLLILVDDVPPDQAGIRGIGMVISL